MSTTFRKPDQTIPPRPGHEITFKDYGGGQRYGLIIDQGYAHPFRNDEKYYVVSCHGRTIRIGREQIIGVMS